LVGEPEGERPLGRPTLRGGYIKMNLRGVCTRLIWLRIGTSGGLVNTVMNLRVP
jgi:hypothetical protein